MNETVYKDQDTGQFEEHDIGMSEKVQLLANGIYREFEKLIQKYDSSVVKDLMPLVVSVLENLDELEKLRRSNEVELQLFKEDNSALMGQYDREKTTRKSLEDKIMNLEYGYEGEKKGLNEKIQVLETSVRLLELKSRNAQDNLNRMEEKEKEQKIEYQKLYERYTEILKGYADQVEKHKSIHSNMGTLQRGTLHKNNNKGYGDSSDQDDGTGKNEMKKYDSGSNYDLELLEQTLTNNMREEELVPELVSDILDADQAKIDEDSENTKIGDEHDEHENTDEYENDDDDDDDSEFGFGKEIDNLLKENADLVETKNALNIVKDDLIKQLDFLNGENDMLKCDLEAFHNRELDLKARIANLEHDYKELRQQNESFKSKLENVDESKDNKRFTRVEIAILLKERNQYKERLLELEDALRYTELVRASKQHPDLVLDNKSKQPTGIMDLFRNLLKTIDDVGGIEEGKLTKETTQTGRPRDLSTSRSSISDHQISTSSTKKIVTQKKNFVFKEYNNRSQLYGWSVPKELSQSSVACHVPTPVASHSILETKDSIVCVTKSAITDDDHSPFLWIILERPAKENKHTYHLAQFSLTTHNEITPTHVNYLKVLRKPCSLMALPELNRVIEDRYSFVVDDFPSPIQSPGEQANNLTMSDYVKVSRVHNTKAKVKQRNCLDQQHSKTMWISFEDGTVVIYSISSTNAFDGRIATILLPGPVSCMKYFQGRIFMAQTDGCLAVFDLKSTNDSWEYNQCLMVEMSHNSPITSLAEHRNTNTVWFGSDQYCYIIGAAKLNFKFSFRTNDNDSSPDQHISRIECIYGTSIETSLSGQPDLMWISMSQVGRLYAYDSYSHERKLSLDLRECLSSIIESVDTKSKFRFSFPLIMEDRERIWLGSDCGFIVCLSKQLISLSSSDENKEDPISDMAIINKHVYVSCHGFSGNLVNIVSIPTLTQCSTASTPNSSNSLSPSNQPTTKKIATTPSETSPTQSIIPALVIALGSSYVNLNSSPSKVSIDDYINRNNVLIWKV